MEAARYWRINGVEAYGYRDDLELSAIEFFEGGARVDAGATITSTIAPTSGSTSNLGDGTLGTIAHFSGADVALPGFSLQWDMGASVYASEIRFVSSASTANFIYNCSIQNSVDGVTWVEGPTLSGILPPGAYATRALSIANSDIYFSNVVLLLHCDGANASTSLVDSSSYGRVATPVGNAQLTTTGPKMGTACASFDGTGDNWTFPNVTSVTLNNSAFTIEGWAYANVNTELNFILSHRELSSATAGGWYIYMSATGKLVGVLEGGPSVNLILTGTTTVPVNTWFSFAMTADTPGGTCRLFLNGAVEASGTVPTLWAASDEPLRIGSSSGEDGTRDWNGKLDEIRITKGVNRYIANYTPLATPFPTSVGTDSNFANVKLLLHGNGANGSTSIVDSGVDHKAISVFGSTQISTAQSKFGGSSIKFNGTSDYLNTAGAAGDGFFTGTASNDFTFECWYFTNSASTNQAIVTIGEETIASGFDISFGVHHFGAALGGLIRAFAYNTVGTQFNCDSLAALSASTWYHIAYVRLAGVLSLYINGALQSSATFTGTGNTTATHMFRVGRYGSSDTRYLDGYIDELRFTNGVCRYSTAFTPQPSEFADSSGSDSAYANSVLLLQGNGANGSTTIIDKSPIPKSISALQGAAVSTAQSKFGGSSLAFDNATHKYLSIPYSSDFALIGGDFTIRTWFYAINWASWSVFYENGASFVIRLLQNNVIVGSTNVTVSSISMSTWHHFELSVISNVGYIFLDGTLISTVANFSSTASTTASGNILIGSEAIQWGFSGYLDDYQIIKGLGLHSSAFTPPSTEAVSSSGSGVNIYRTVVGAGAAPTTVNKQAVPSISLPTIYVPQRSFDTLDGGFYRVAGTVKEKALPANTSLRRMVRLFIEKNGRLIRETWSDATTGEYSFDYIRGDCKYTVVSYDYTNSYRAVIADNVTPDLIT